MKSEVEERSDEIPLCGNRRPKIFTSDFRIPTSDLLITFYSFKTVLRTMITNKLFYFVLLLLLLSCCTSKSGKKGNPELSSSEQIALKPPMGWNSFDAFDCRINEEQFKKTVDFMAENLLQFGWNYAVIDYIWWHPSPGDWKNPKFRYGHPNIRYAADGKPLDPTTIDEFGRLLPAVERFPSAAGGKGFKPLADYVHGKGLKFGIHIMRGIHRYAAYNKLPVKGTLFNLGDLVEKSDTCKWCNHMYGVDAFKPGAQEYYNSLFELYASWDVDFIKVDDILFPTYHKEEIEMIRKAIDKCGRPMVLSLSPGEAPLDMAGHVIKNANMWRISADFWDDWEKLKHNFKLLEEWAPFQKTGTWPDADMLPIGRLSVDGRPHGPERNSKFTWPEHYTLLSLWSISRSPLMIGADLLNSSDSTMLFLTNPEVIAVNQNSSGNRPLYTTENESVWVADDPETVAKYIALFNLADSASTINFDFNSIELKGKVKIRDLWKREDLGIFETGYSINLQPHGAALIKIVMD